MSRAALQWAAQSRAKAGRNYATPWEAVEAHAPDEEHLSNPGLLKIWGNQRTFNVEEILATNIVTSKDFIDWLPCEDPQEVLEEINRSVTSVEPFKVGRTPSLAFTLLFRLFVFRLTKKQITAMINHPSNLYLRAIGFLYLRYACPPTELWSWVEPAIDDPTPFWPAGRDRGGRMSFGEWVRSLFTQQRYCGSSLLPRIPVKEEREIQVALALAEKDAARVEPSIAAGVPSMLLPGTAIRARWSGDGKWYAALINGPVAEKDTANYKNKWWVHYPEFGPADETSEMRSLGQIEVPGVAITISPTTTMAAPTSSSSTSSFSSSYGGGAAVPRRDRSRSRSRERTGGGGGGYRGGYGSTSSSSYRDRDGDRDRDYRRGGGSGPSYSSHSSSFNQYDRQRGGDVGGSSYRRNDYDDGEEDDVDRIRRALAEKQRASVVASGPRDYTSGAGGGGGGGHRSSLAVPSSEYGRAPLALVAPPMARRDDGDRYERRSASASVDRASERGYPPAPPPAASSLPYSSSSSSFAAAAAAPAAPASTGGAPTEEQMARLKRLQDLQRQYGYGDVEGDSRGGGGGSGGAGAGGGAGGGRSLGVQNRDGEDVVRYGGWH